MLAEGAAERRRNRDRSGHHATRTRERNLARAMHLGWTDSLVRHHRRGGPRSIARFRCVAAAPPRSAPLCRWGCVWRKTTPSLEEEFVIHGGERKMIGIRQEVYPGAERAGGARANGSFPAECAPREIEVLHLADVAAEPIKMQARWECAFVSIQCGRHGRRRNLSKPRWSPREKQIAQGRPRRPRREQRTDLAGLVRNVAAVGGPATNRALPGTLEHPPAIAGRLKRERILNAVLHASALRGRQIRGRPPGVSPRIRPFC